MTSTSGRTVSAQDVQKGELRDSRIYGNTEDGVQVSFENIAFRLNFGLATIQGNSIYSNATGIADRRRKLDQSSFSGSSEGFDSSVVIRNNLFYDHSQQAMLIDAFHDTDFETTRIESNTVYEPAADGIVLAGKSQNVVLKNNIVYVGGSNRAAVTVAAAAQRGFESDYNLFHATGGTAVGKWQEISVGGLLDWSLELGQDTRIRSPAIRCLSIRMVPTACSASSPAGPTAATITSHCPVSPEVTTAALGRPTRSIRRQLMPVIRRLPCSRTRLTVCPSAIRSRRNMAGGSTWRLRQHAVRFAVARRRASSYFPQRPGKIPHRHAR